MNYEFQTDNILWLNWQINCKHELWMTKQQYFTIEIDKRLKENYEWQSNNIL